MRSTQSHHLCSPAKNKNSTLSTQRLTCMSERPIPTGSRTAEPTWGRRACNTIFNERLNVNGHRKVDFAPSDGFADNLVSVILKILSSIISKLRTNTATVPSTKIDLHRNHNLSVKFRNLMSSSSGAVHFWKTIWRCGGQCDVFFARKVIVSKFPAKLNPQLCWPLGVYPIGLQNPNLLSKDFLPIGWKETINLTRSRRPRMVNSEAASILGIGPIFVCPGDFHICDRSTNIDKCATDALGCPCSLRNFHGWYSKHKEKHHCTWGQWKKLFQTQCWFLIHAVMSC